MDNRGKNIFMACVGGYLMYTGYNLIVDVMSRNPANKVLFLIAGAVFVIFGLLTVIMNLKYFFKDFKKDVFEADEVTEAETEEADVEESAERQNHVEIVEITKVENAEESDIEYEEEATEEEAEELEEE